MNETGRKVCFYIMKSDSGFAPNPFHGVCTLATLFAIILAVATAHARTNEVIFSKIVGVHDGDSITLLTPAKVQVKIRLNGIDAPESKQPFSAQSKKALSEMVFGKSVKVTVTDTDRYGRTVGDVHVDGQWVNLQMVAGGWAWHYKAFSKSVELAEAEVEARRKRLGLWADRNAVPPWEYRKEGRAK